MTEFVDALLYAGDLLSIPVCPFKPGIVTTRPQPPVKTSLTRQQDLYLKLLYRSFAFPDRTNAIGQLNKFQQVHRNPNVKDDLQQNVSLRATQSHLKANFNYLARQARRTGGMRALKTMFQATGREVMLGRPALKPVPPARQTPLDGFKQNALNMVALCLRDVVGHAKATLNLDGGRRAFLD